MISARCPRLSGTLGTTLNGRHVPRGFDGSGNYTLGLKEQIIFPEIEFDKVDKIKGMNITFVTTAQTDEEAKELLGSLGMPFRS